MTDDNNFEVFTQALPDLLKSDRNSFVAFAGGRLIDRNLDEFSLAERVAREHPRERVLIQRVVETELVGVHMDTPEFSASDRVMDEGRASEHVPLRVEAWEGIRRQGRQLSDNYLNGLQPGAQRAADGTPGEATVSYAGGGVGAVRTDQTPEPPQK